MKFKNMAYLFDTLNLHLSDKSTFVYCITTFVGNPLYINAYAKELLKDTNPESTIDWAHFDEWIQNADNLKLVIPLLIKLWENKEKLGIVSFFIEKDYARFIYQLTLMCKTLNAKEANTQKMIAELYSDYSESLKDQRESAKPYMLDDVYDFLTHQLQRNEYSVYKNILKDSLRTIDELKAIASIMTEGISSDIIENGYYIFGKKLITYYQEKGVGKVYQRKNSHDRFKDTITFYRGNYEFEEATIDRTDDNLRSVLVLADIVLGLSDHIFNKVARTEKLEELSDIDKYIFLIVWTLFCSEEGNWFFNSKIYDNIQHVIGSLKKEFSV